VPSFNRTKSEWDDSGLPEHSRNAEAGCCRVGREIAIQRAAFAPVRGSKCFSGEDAESTGDPLAADRQMRLESQRSTRLKTDVFAAGLATKRSAGLSQASSEKGSGDVGETGSRGLLMAEDSIDAFDATAFSKSSQIARLGLSAYIGDICHRAEPSKDLGAVWPARIRQPQT